MAKAMGISPGRRVPPFTPRLPLPLVLSLIWLPTSALASLYVIHRTAENARIFLQAPNYYQFYFDLKSVAIFLKLVGPLWALWLLQIVPMAVLIVRVGLKRRSPSILGFLRGQSLSCLFLSFVSGLLLSHLAGAELDLGPTAILAPARLSIFDLNFNPRIFLCSALILFISALNFAYARYSSELATFYFYPDAPPASQIFDRSPLTILLSAVLIPMLYQAAYQILLIFNFLAIISQQWRLSQHVMMSALINPVSLLCQSAILSLALMSVISLPREISGKKTGLHLYLMLLALMFSVKILMPFLFFPANTESDQYSPLSVGLDVFFLTAAFFGFAHICRLRAAREELSAEGGAAI